MGWGGFIKKVVLELSLQGRNEFESIQSGEALLAKRTRPDVGQAELVEDRF